MEKASRPMNDTPTCSTAQLARVSRLIQMITEFKTNSR